MISCQKPDRDCGICSLLKQPGESEDAYRARMRTLAGPRNPRQMADLEQLYTVMAADAAKSWRLLELANALGVTAPRVSVRLRRAIDAGRVEKSSAGFRLLEAASCPPQ